MLQSDKHREAIEFELEAFLQDQSKPFVVWLLKEIEARTSKQGQVPAASSDEPVSPPTRRAAAASADEPWSPPSGGPGRSSAGQKKRPAPGIAASLFGRAVRAAQSSAKTQGGAEGQVSPPKRTERVEPKRAARSLQDGAADRSLSRSRSRGRSATPPAAAAGKQVQDSPRVRGRASTFASAVANAVASTADARIASDGTRSLPPRPRRAPPLPPPPRALPTHMAPGGGAGPVNMLGRAQDVRFAHDSRWGPPPLLHGSAPFHGGVAPGPPPAQPPPQGVHTSASAPPGDSGSARNSPSRRRARLAPVKSVKVEDEEDTSRWKFQAAPAAGPPPSGPPPSAFGSPAAASVSVPYQMVAGAPGYVWPAPGYVVAGAPGPLPSGTLSGSSRAGASAHAAPPPLIPTVFESHAVASPAPTPAISTQRVSAPPRPRNFVPQKWRVIAVQLDVSSTEHLDSQKVRTLKEGEIVESVGPPFALTNGVVRLEITHPSSAQYPSPIGWVTQDASAADGTKNLEPGPQPLSATPRTSAPHQSFGKGGGKGKWSQPRPRGKGSFSNVSWRPPSG